ncbi:GTP-binding protein, partial [Victivallis vadensis]
MTKATECRNFVIAGHAGSGKSTLSELMLYKAGAIGRPGTVDAKNTVSDFMADEQERRASIYSTCMNCMWKNNQFFFVDTPGYGEFIGQAAAAVRAADAALVVIDAIDGPQVGTARAWKMTKERRIPRFALVNRLDKERADFKATLEVMRGNHGRSVIIPLYWPVGSGDSFNRVVNVLFDRDIPAEIADDVAECRGLWLDAIAETDDELMMRYLDGEQLGDEEVLAGLKKSIKLGHTIPVFAGSSVKDVGITELMDAIIELFPTPLSYVTVDGAKRKISEDADAIGIVFKSINDPFIGQLTFVRVVSGIFKGDSDVWNLSRPGVKERIGSMFFMNGKSQTAVHEAGPGSIFAIAKLKDTHVGDTISANQNEKALPGITFPAPVMSYAVSAQKSGDDEKIAAGLHKIIECIPTVRLG